MSKKLKLYYSEIKFASFWLYCKFFSAHFTILAANIDIILILKFLIVSDKIKNLWNNVMCNCLYELYGSYL